MGFWTNKDRGDILSDAEDLAYPPTGGRAKMWIVGVGIAFIPIAYGLHCFLSGEARFFDRYGPDLELHGAAAKSLAIAFVAVGAFVHFHWFWGLHPRLMQFSSILKVLALLAFLASFVFTMYRILI